MRQIRNNVFETNSSSTHSITMCLENEYDDWKKRKVYLNDGDSGRYSYSEFKNKRFVTREEAVDILVKNKYPLGEFLELRSISDLEDCFYNNEIYTYENYWNNDLESYINKFTTPNGEKIIAFGQYGYD